MNASRINGVDPIAAILERTIIRNMEVNDMKIAVASEGKMVTEHFGHCESFIIFDTEKGKIAKSESVPNPGHRPGFLPNFLNDLGEK